MRGLCVSAVLALVMVVLSASGADACGKGKLGFLRPLRAYRAARMTAYQTTPSAACYTAPVYAAPVYSATARNGAYQKGAPVQKNGAYQRGAVYRSTTSYWTAVGNGPIVFHRMTAR